MDGPGVSLFQGVDSIRLNNSNQREEEEFLEEEKIRKAELQDLIENAFSDLDGEDDEDDSSISSSRCSKPCRELSNGRGSYTSSNYSSQYSSRLGFGHEHQDPVRDTYSDDLRIATHALSSRGNIYDDNFAENNHVSAHRNHCFHANPSAPVIQSDPSEVYKQTDFNGTDQIKVLYEVRLREIERLSKELEAEKEEKDGILRKLAVCEHDKKNLEISLNATKTLLAESRKKISELENEITSLQENIKGLERSKDEVRSELEITKSQLYHEKQKYHALERSDLNAKREKQMDLVIESLKSNHRSEINILQQQLDAALERINKKEDDYNALEKKLEEMSQKHAESLLNKCDSAMRQEATVKALLDEANKEKLELMKKINSLQHECNMLRNDLEQYDSFPQLRLNENSSTDEKETDSFILLSSGWKSESKKKGMNLTHTDLVNKLKEELHRALMGQRTKRKEIMKLQEQVQTKELQISKMKEQERLYLSQTESLKADMNKILQQAEKARNKSKENEQSQLILQLQADIVEIERESSAKTQRISDLEKEIHSLKEQFTSLEEKYKKQRDEYLEFHDKGVLKLQNDTERLLKDKELEWGREMEKLLTECDEIKHLYLEIKSKKDELSTKLVQLQQMNDDLKKEKLELELELSRKQEDIKQLEDHILLIGKDKNPSDESLLKEVKKELNNIIDKQNVEIMVLKSKLQEAAKTDEALIELKNESAQSKMRYIELERTLKEEFQSSLIKLKDENCILKDLLKKKEAELSLRKLCVQNQKKDVSVGTEEVFFIETINEQNLAEINKLEKEIDRLRTQLETKSQEILRLRASQEQLMYEELQKLEKKLSDQHQKEIELAEKKVKELSLKYFSEEIEKLQTQYSEDLKAVRDEENRKIEEIKMTLIKKEDEIRNLMEKKDQLELALKNCEAERTRVASIMAQWAKEVAEVKDEKDKLVLEMEHLQKSNEIISKSLEELKLKLKDTRKAALVYKRRLREVKANLSEKYNNLIIDIQKKVDEVISAKEADVKEKLEQIENDYKTREKLLRLQAQTKDVT